MATNGRGSGREGMQRSSCLFSSSSGLDYRSKELSPQSGNPLVVFDEYFVTQQKVELVLKVEAVPDEFIVKSVRGDHWFTIARKRSECSEERVIQTANGEIICSIHKNEYPQVEGFSIVSHLGCEPIVALELHSKKKSRLRKMYGSIARGGGSRTRSNLKIKGDLENRMYGITWNEVGKKKGPMVAMTWDVCPEGTKKIRGCAKYVMEIPAGVDAASMVAVATAICEGDIPLTEACKIPLEPQLKQGISVFGNSFVTNSQTSLVMSDVNKRLNVIDATGCIQVSMDGLGVCRTQDGRNVFQVGDDGMSIHGVTSDQKIVNIAFSLYETEGGPQYMLAVVTCSGQSLNKIVLVVPLDPSSGGVFPVRRVILNGDQTDTWLKNGPVIARIVIPTRVNHSFETWFQNARSQSPCSALPTTPPEIGIGADVASGVDICLVTALMLIMIKASPAAKRINARLTRIQKLGALPSKRKSKSDHQLNQHSQDGDYLGRQMKSEGSIVRRASRGAHFIPSNHPC